MFYTSAIDAVFETHEVTLGQASLIPDPEDPLEVADAESYADWLQDYLPPGEEVMEPISEITYPIVDQHDAVQVMDESYNVTEHNLVGIMSLGMYWRDNLKDILPPGSDGIVIVFENPCNPTFTYQIDGPMVTYLGRGDLHDTKYDELEQSSGLFELSSFSVRESKYSGFPVNQDYCPFFVRIFPSATMESTYVTNNPVLFTVGAILIFAFTAFVSGTYPIYTRDLYPPSNSSLLVP